MASRIFTSVVVALAFAGVATAQETPTRSGLPWPSGTTKPPDEFASWRGRPLDLRTMFFGKRTWEHMRASANGRPVPYQVVIGMGMLPDSHRGQLAQCATGAFDREITAIRDNMLRNGYGPRPGIPRTIIRLGWEANRVGGFAWAVIGNGNTWVGCWRRWVDIFNPLVDEDDDPATPPVRTKNFDFAWNMSNLGTFPYPIEQMWPGADYVDVVASQWYDRCPPITTDAEWTRRMQMRDRWGNPASPRQWLEWAKAKGKPYAIPEWGIGGSQSVCRRPGIDNPFFMAKMANFFRAWAGDISFESYFNHPEGSGSHELYPTYRNPRAAAAYKRFWGR